jgi:hypothetical protein
MDEVDRLLIRSRVEREAAEAFLDIANDRPVAHPDETDAEFIARVKERLRSRLAALHPHGGDACAPVDDAQNEKRPHWR